MSYWKMAYRDLDMWTSPDADKTSIQGVFDLDAVTTEKGVGRAVCEARNVLVGVIGDLMQRLSDAGLLDYDEAQEIFAETRDKMHKAEGSQ